MAAKTIVITGCTRGLGRALVDRFVEAGWQVAGCGRSVADVAALENTYPQGLFRSVDTTDAGAMEAFAGEVHAKWGAPDLLINNAALINKNAPLWEVPAEEFASLMQVNLTGVFHGIRSFTPSMIKAGRGIIVNLSSGWGRSTAPEVAPYCATKWGIEGLTQALAQELPQGVITVALNPGVIDTAMLRSCYGTAASHYPTPQQWSHHAFKFLSQLRASDNGRSLTVS